MGSHMKRGPAAQISEGWTSLPSPHSFAELWEQCCEGFFLSRPCASPSLAAQATRRHVSNAFHTGRGDPQNLGGNGWFFDGLVSLGIAWYGLVWLGYFWMLVTQRGDHWQLLPCQHPSLARTRGVNSSRTWIPKVTSGLSLLCLKDVVLPRLENATSLSSAIARHSNVYHVISCDMSTQSRKL